MSTVHAIAKREDVSPQEGKSKYGDVTYADEKNKKYPLDSEKHVRAAWSYINMPKNAGKYSSADVATIKRKIKAAGKKYGIEFSGNGDKAESHLIRCDFSTYSFVEGAIPDEIVYLPKGRHRISPTLSGAPANIEVEVDENAAMLLINDLADRLAKHVPPYAGFDHAKGPAAFHPKAMKWDDQKGILLEVDWTDAGKAAIAGRNYGHFSPTFLWDGKRIEGLPANGEIGSLTNNPAFDDVSMPRIAAEKSDSESMKKLTDRLVELEIVSAEAAEGADEDYLVRVVNGLHEQLASSQAACARLTSENTALAAKVQAIAKSEAETMVQAAIREGKIPAKEQGAIDFWTQQLVSSPVTAKAALAAIPINPLLTKVIDVKASDSKKIVGNQTDLVQAQHLAVSKVRKANPGLTHQEAFNQARLENPELFPVEA